MKYVVFIVVIGLLGNLIKPIDNGFFTALMGVVFWGSVAYFVWERWDRRKREIRMPGLDDWLEKPRDE